MRTLVIDMGIDPKRCSHPTWECVPVLRTPLTWKWWVRTNRCVFDILRFCNHCKARI